MKKREERDGLRECGQVQEATLFLACAELKDNCGCGRTSQLPLRYGSNRRPFAGRMTHPKISLRLVVVKGNSKIVEEPERSPLAPRESIQQIASWALFGSLWCSLGMFRLLWWWGRRIGLVSLCEDFIIAQKQACQYQSLVR